MDKAGAKTPLIRFGEGFNRACHELSLLLNDIAISFEAPLPVHLALALSLAELFRRYTSLTWDEGFSKVDKLRSSLAEGAEKIRAYTEKGHSRIIEAIKLVNAIKPASTVMPEVSSDPLTFLTELQQKYDEMLSALKMFGQAFSKDIKDTNVEQYLEKVVLTMGFFEHNKSDYVKKLRSLAYNYEKVAIGGHIVVSIKNGKTTIEIRGEKANALAETRPDSKQETVELTDTENNILEALGNGTMHGPDLLKKAGYDNSSHYRTILSNLVKRKILDRNTSGYHRKSVFCQ